MNKQIIAIVITILVIGGSIFALWTMNNSSEKVDTKTSVKTTGNVVKSTSSASKSSTSTKTTAPNYANLVKNLPKNPMIQDLPSGKSLYVRFFSFPKGERVWEKSYILTKDGMKEGTLDNAEVTLIVHSKYVNQITSSNLCDVMKKANTNKDLGFESELGYASLAWKYSSLMKYKSCFSS